MTLPATIYARFSSLEQAKGISLERQFELADRLAQQHGWDVTSRISDQGKSAFSGANRQPGGALCAFEQQVAEGLYRNGHVLIVERIDRLSRQGWQEVLPLISMLTENGVTVAISDGGRIYPAYERVPMASVIEAVLKSELAFEESANKSRHSRINWEKRIQRAEEGSRSALSTQSLGWIAVNKKTREMSLIEDRAKLLNEIFDLTIEGFGTPAIAKRFNGRGEPVWKKGRRVSKNGWTVGTLTKILTNRAVMGEYHPMRRARSMALAEMKGIVVMDFYPQAIDPHKFAQAQKARASRKNTSGAWQISHNNLFSGIAKCAHCSGPMRFQLTARKGVARKGTNGSRQPYVHYPANDTSYLTCQNAFNKVWDHERGALLCTNRSRVRYEHIEPSILDMILHHALHDATVENKATANRLKIAIADAERLISDKTARLNKPHFMSSNAVASFMALVYDNASSSFLKDIGLSDHQIRVMLCYQTEYQAIMRCSLRDPAAVAPVTVIVPSKASADWIASKFDGADIAKLDSGLDWEPKKNGRPASGKKALTAAERMRAMRQRKKAVENA